MNRFRTASLILLVAGCGSGLSKTMIINHPKLSLAAMKPQVVEASVPIAPAWIHRLDRGAVDYVPFTGQSYASNLEEAKTAASRDLLTAIASYVAVNVQSELETIESESTKNGRTSSSVSTTQRTRASTSASISGVRPDEVYWEKVLVSPLVPDRYAYRVYVHARVKRAVITKARLSRQLARSEDTNKQTLVVLPFRSADRTAEAKRWERGFALELSRRLAGADGLYVQDPELVDGLLAGETASEVESLSAIRESLLPDFVVGGSYQVNAGRVKATFTLYRGDAVVKTESVVRPVADLFELQDDIVSKIALALGAAKERTEAPRVDPTATDIYYAAYEAYRAGQNESAIALLSKAIAIDDSDARFHMRLGRVLERLGRYGSSRPKAASTRVAEMLAVCTPWYLVTPLEPRQFFEAASAGPARKARRQQGADIDDVASAITYTLLGGPTPELDVAPVASAAVGAYWHAFVRARRANDVVMEREVQIAIGDLLNRNDRFDEAKVFFDRVVEAALAAKDLHHESLARLGLGRAARERGDLDGARNALLAARAIRWRTLERPYLLEIENELGQVELEASRYVAARAHFAEALRIAEDLDDDYFRAVLGNNLGVLELINGHADRAESFFHRAWRALSDLDEAEGRISTNLNIGYVDGSRGDIEAARAYLRAARELVEATGQSSRRAQLSAHEAHLDQLRGRNLDALRSLLSSYALYERINRRAAALRVETNIAAVELRAALDARQEDDDGRIACVQQSFRRLIGKLGANQSSRASVDHLYALLGLYVAGSLR